MVKGLKGILVILAGEIDPRQGLERGRGNCFFAGESGGVIVDDRRVLSHNPVIRAAEVLFLDICPWFFIMRLRGIRFNISIQPLFRSIEWTILGITGHLAPGSRGMQPEGPESSLVSFPTDTLQNVGLHDSPSLERGGKTFIWQDNPGTIQQAFLPAPAVTLMVIEG